MSLELSVIAPCYNEEANIAELVERFRKLFELKKIDGELILVNDGSSDNTGAKINEFAEKYAFVKPIHHPQNLGIEGGWNSGVQAAQGNYVCLIDSDLQNLPEDTYRLLREIKNSGSDLVQGYRSSIGRLKDSRYTLSKGLNFLLNTLFGMRAKDNKSGFIITKRESLLDILSHRYSYRYFQSFITVAAKSKGYTIREIETLFESRLQGDSFLAQFPAKAVFWCFVDLAKAFSEYRLRPKQDSILSAFLAENPPTREDKPLGSLRKLWFNLFFLTCPLHKWMITSRAKHYYNELKKSQYLPLEKIRELQLIKLRRMIAHAYHHVGYYREHMDEAGLKPEDIKSLDDIRKLPLLEKDDVRNHLYFDLLSDNHDKKKILKIQTSGSTGEPFVCFADQHQLEIRWAATQRSLEWTGYRFGDRSARLWHQTLGMSWSQIARERIDAWFNRRLFIPAYEMSDKNIKQMVDKLRAHQPVLIDGYAESFNFLASYLKDNDLRDLNIKGLVSSAQVLPDQSREIIEKSFGCGVYDKYGSREFSGIAYECGAHDGHHVVAESYIVEILKDGVPAKPGEMGEVVITDLNNFCMPLIRYRVGDLAVAMDDKIPCECGRGLPKIGKIEGRVQAIIVADNGAYIPGTFFAHYFKDYDHIIRQYQVVQEALGSITLRIIKALRFDDESFQQILDGLKRYVGENMKIDVQFVDKIEMVRTGKHQGSISKLKINYQSGKSAEPLKRTANL